MTIKNKHDLLKHNLDLANTRFRDEIYNMEQRLSSVLEVLAGNHWWKDLEGHYLGCNKAVANELGMNPKDIIGKTDFDLPWKDQAETLRENDLKVIEADVPIKFEEHLISKTGEKLTYLVCKSPMKNLKGKTIGVIGSSVDITKQKTLEENLKKLKDQLEQANQLKTQFISSLEHDLRSPASGLAALASSLEKEETNEPSKKNLQLLSRAAEQLLEVLNQILEQNHTEEVIQPILEKKFSLSSIIQNVINLETPVAKIKGINLQSYVESRIPDFIIGDDVRTYRILLNLITNSIKFTSAGTIKILASLAKKKNKEIIIKLEVIDSGIGIPKEKQNILFEQHNQTQQSQNNYTGSGMGLRIIKNFLTDLRGEIEVKSKPGKGSHFTCFIPFKLPILISKTHKKNSQCSTHPHTSPLVLLHKVLLIEDDSIAQFIGRKLLVSSFGCKVDIASTAARASHLVNTKKFDIIFSDLELPDKNGEELAQEFRKKGITVPIIALTAQGKSVKNDCLKAGMNDFVTKPVSFEQIKKLFKKWLPKSSHTVINASTQITTKKSKNQIINYESALAVASRKDLAKKLFIKFITTLEKLEKDFNQAYKAKDAKKIIMLGHVTKGACRYCGAEKLEKTAAKIEKLKGQKVNWKYLSKLYQALMSDIKVTQSEIPKFL
ncbi:MAG: ATP-binding protein [Gammaproteobacteria bacterium]